MSDEYAWWRAALEGRPGDLTLNKAEPGFYRHQTREGWVPVAIWRDGERTFAQVGSKPQILADEAFCESVFSRCCRHPVSDDAYWAVMEGGLWPDAPPAIAKANLPESEYEAVKTLLADERRDAEAWLSQIGKVGTKEQADRAINWANRIAELEKRAEAARKREKQPFLDEARAVDDQWQPVVKGAAELKRKLKDASTAFLLAEDRRLKEEARRKAEEQAAKGEPVLVDMNRLPSAKAGTVGHTAGLRTVKTAVIDDYDAALAFFCDHEDLRALVQTLANRAVRAGVVPAGCRLVETKQVA